ncbi:tripartite tricarboxylate transporter TctB family protein [Aquamicrobium sp. LC103]|uniref:tripartite tricarboxylate transporter TctB family protein n=1 Tax=Aquamicrobium sp. LC103 TaxID=1120658 RepID=UPI000A748411|nr:tripartite tricarboxylate transporter TctB family protein [Aquamicrobium sp. LC103]TKT69439.1 tripartite tricarboxylate transporter TctB family protein [Aquamicrobium sp. LC103]
MNRIVVSSDFLSGALFMLFGGGFILIARGYELGTSVQMGPGYFPLALGCGVVLIGLALCGKAFLAPAGGECAAEFHVRPALFVLGGMIVFGLALRPFGLIVSAVLMVVVASFAGSERRWWEVVLLACGLAIFSALVFVEALGVPMPLWPRGL